MSRLPVWRLAVLLLLVAGVATYATFTGSVPIAWQDTWAALVNRQGDHVTIVLDLRLPRVLLVILVGAGLAAAGCAYQALFRNPLADPFVIGASAGAALGATVAIVLGVEATLGGMTPIASAAFAGTLGAVGLAYALGATGQRSSPLTLLLAGAAISTVLSALVSLLILIDDRSLQMVYYWLLGGFSGRGWAHLGGASGFIVAGSLCIWLMSRPLDAMTLGDESARGVGLHVGRARAGIVIAASLATAAAVSVAGIIAFVGLMSPHLARMLFGGRHAVLVPASMLLGAAILTVADLVARTALAPIEIPVGILTALLGGPFFLYVLRVGSRGPSA